MDYESGQPLGLERSRTEGRISITGNGIAGCSTPADPESSPRLLQRSRTEIATPSSAMSGRTDFDVDRVLYEISRKVVANKKSLLYLFRNNDPSGRGAISREALHRIMRVLYGFLPPDNFAKILRRLNIHNRSQITYDVFMACFEDAEPLQKRYLRKTLLEPFWRAASAGHEEGEIELLDSRDERKFLDVGTGMPRSNSADDRLSSLKHRLVEAFPAIQANFSKDEPKDFLLTSKMLRTVMEKAGVIATIEEANSLWEKLDTARCGLVPLRRLYTFVDPLFVQKWEKKSSDPVNKAFPAPTKSQIIPRLAMGSKSAVGNTRSLTHYRYPPLQEENGDTPEKFLGNGNGATVQQSLPHRPAFPHVPPPHVSRSIAQPQKRALVLDSDKPVLVQLVNRLVEPREHFMTFCRRFDDEHGSGRIALGQLLGCLLFCGKTVPDNLVSQLMQKIGGGVKCSGSDDAACTTTGGATEQCEPKKYDYKSLGCTMYDADSNRLLASVLQNPEHYFRLLRSDLTSDWCESEPLNYEIVEVKFMKFMYNDIIRLITELRRLDRGNSGVVSDKDFEMAMTRVFNTTFSRKQIVELTKGAVTDEGIGGVVIAEFVKSMFSTAQPDICRILAMSSAPNKRGFATNKVTTGQNAASSVATNNKEATAPAPANEASSLFEQNANAQPSTFGVSTEMSEEDAVHLFKQIMKDRFHTFDKQFIALDVKQTKRISQFQLHQILRNMNIHLSMRELGYMWKFVPVDADGLCSYRRFLLHFMTGGSNSNNNNNLSTYRSTDASAAAANNSSNAASTENFVPSNNNNDSAQQFLSRQEKLDIDQVLECIRTDVCRQWGVLKERIRQEDTAGSGSFEADRLTSVIKGSGIDITDEALNYLSKKYISIVRNRRRFFYMPFMRYFTKRFAQETNNGADHKCDCRSS